VSIQDTASRLLRKYGETVSIRFETGGDIDPATGQTRSAADVVTIIGFGYPSNYEQGEIDGTHIETGDIRLVLERINQRPETSWRCTIDDKSYRIMDVQPIRKSGFDVLYIVQLRQL